MFHLRATDCADKDSDDDAVVRVKIKNEPAAKKLLLSMQEANCKPGIYFFKISQINLTSCLFLIKYHNQ